jgi:hypothetical protein
MLTVIKDSQGIAVLGVKYEYVLTGSRRIIVNGKGYKVPPGVAFSLLYDEFARFSVKEFVEANIKNFPELADVPIR